jgi:hypothetical protein
VAAIRTNNQPTPLEPPWLLLFAVERPQPPGAPYP